MIVIKKILIANRGEIALRIMHTARRMNISTVAVYSEADRLSPHVKFADEAIFIGASISSESYLNMDKIIAAAVKSGADAIHPGYGFLSENPLFAARVNESGITFIGPSAESIRTMGNKISAKEAAANFDVPLVPGTQAAIKDLDHAKKVAAEIGYPVLIKAAAGGGGKGMRVVNKESNLEEQMSRATSEATSAFGDGAVFIEKYVSKPRHIEIQILADQHGNAVYLFERECSIQRRHQKVIEEAPSVLIDSSLREKMGKAAIDVAKACNYVGAGTVEFLLDAEREFYFLEMNTRLQVEHPVTEYITGIDLVEQQIRIARGEPLNISQADLQIYGHAIELRVYAEDPGNEFAPSIGILNKYQPPTGTGIRYDDGFEEGMQIPIYYDPMLGKLVVHAADRESAIRRMLRAIDGFLVDGISTTLSFGRFVLNHPAFQRGDYDTNFVSDEFSSEKLDAEFEPDRREVAQLALELYLKDKGQIKLPLAVSSIWKHSRRQWR